MERLPAMPDNLPPSPPKEKPPVCNEQNLELKIRPGYRLVIDVRTGQRGLPLFKIDRWFNLFRFIRESAMNPARLAFAAILISAVVLLTGLPHDPMRFTPGEAYSSVRAAELLQSGLRSKQGQVLPAFFQGEGGSYSLGASVYLQLLPQLLGFGTVVWVRGFNAVLSLAGLSWLAWTLWRVYRLAYAWMVLPLAAGLPIWFYFSRSGSEAIQAAVFGSAALAGYVFYRSERTRWLPLAGLLGWLAFYTNPAMRLATMIACVLLGISDYRYHIAHRHAWLITAVLSLPFAAAFIRSLVTFPGLLTTEVWQNGLVDQFLQVVNPFFWMTGSENIRPMYTFEGPPLGWPALPLAAWGLVQITRRFQGWENRVVLIALVSAVAGPALSGPKIETLLPFVLALAVLATFGLHDLLSRMARRWQRMPAWLPGMGLLLILGAICLGLFISTPG